MRQPSFVRGKMERSHISNAMQKQKRRVKGQFSNNRQERHKPGRRGSIGYYTAHAIHFNPGDLETYRRVNDQVRGQDAVILEAQKPEELPLDLQRS